MTVKPKAPQKKTSVNVSDKNTLKIKQDNEKSENRLFAEIGLSSSVLNTFTAITYAKGSMGEISITDAVAVMKDKVNQVNANDTKALEGTLTAQATALDAIFNELARRAIGSDTMSKLEIYLRLGLKAQAQCARTIEVIATMKNPPVVFAKQANISNGNQQVNNGSVSNGQAPAHTGEIINQKTNYWRHNIMANGWTKERRQRQAELIKCWKPWEQSTGARTIEGKAKASRNSYKGGIAQQLKELRQCLRDQRAFTESLE